MMAELESPLITEPEPLAAGDEPTVEVPLASDPPLDQPVLPNPTPPPENYHVSIWEDPVTFACLRCALRGVTLEEIEYHLDAAHGEAPVPTPLAAQYSAPGKAPATGEEALRMLGQQAGETEVAPETRLEEAVGVVVPEEEPTRE